MTATQHPISVHTDVTMPSTRIVLPTNFSGDAYSSLTGVGLGQRHARAELVNESADNGADDHRHESTTGTTLRIIATHSKPPFRL